MKKLIHAGAGAVALATAASFWISTAFSELFGSATMIVRVKSTIPWGFLLLVPCIAIAGLTGLSLSKGTKAGLAGKKPKRMPFIAGNGLMVLMPAALFLASRATAGQLDTSFYLVQALELIAGAVNITLLALNMFDGLRMKDSQRDGRRKQGI